MRLKLEELYALVNRVTVRNPPFPIRIWADVDIMSFAVHVVVSWQVKDRDAGHQITVSTVRTIRPEMSEAMTLMVIESAVREAFNHEFAECFHVDGKRIYDPHPLTPKLEKKPIIFDEVVKFKELMMQLDLAMKEPNNGTPGV